MWRTLYLCFKTPKTPQQNSNLPPTNNTVSTPPAVENDGSESLTPPQIKKTEAHSRDDAQMLLFKCAAIKIETSDQDTFDSHYEKMEEWQRYLQPRECCLCSLSDLFYLVSKTEAPILLGCNLDKVKIAVEKRDGLSFISHSELQVRSRLISDKRINNNDPLPPIVRTQILLENANITATEEAIVTTMRSSLQDILKAQSDPKGTLVNKVMVAIKKGIGRISKKLKEDEYCICALEILLNNNQVGGKCVIITDRQVCDLTAITHFNIHKVTRGRHPISNQELEMR